MTTDILRFAVLGLGSGAVYALTALGVVLVYRGSSVINFAHGAIGMIGAYLFYNARAGGVATGVAWLIALGFGAAVGAATHLGIMRPLRHATPLARMIATLGILSIAIAFASNRWGQKSRIVQKLLPVRRIELPFGIAVGMDRLILLTVAVVVTAVTTGVYRYSRFGLDASAVAENRRAAAAQGVSPDLVATVNWIAGSMLSVTGAIFIVNIAGLSVNGLALLVVFALAAALVGGLRSFPLTLAGGLLIGVLQSELSWLQVYLTNRWGRPVALEGWAQSVPFLVIIAVLVLRGKALPLRGEIGDRPAQLGTGVVRATVVMPILVVAVVLVATVLPVDLVTALAGSAALGVVALSLVVVTGYTGQLSLAQMGLAGMGGWICATLVARHGVGFELATLAGVVGAVPIGVLVGLPSLRTRGVNLAIATLGLALVLEAQVLNNSKRTGGITGLNVGPPSFFGIDFDPVAHPERYTVLAMAAFAGLALMVANLRRSRTGRRLVAVRSNERAATALGISVTGAKVYAFGLAAAIASVGGILIVLRRPTAVFFPTFSIFESIYVVVYAVIGGIGFVAGAAIGGVTSPGNALVVLVDRWTGVLSRGGTVAIVLGALLLLTLRLHPNGVASIQLPRWARRTRPADDRSKARRTIGLADGPPPPPITPKSLELKGVSVTFGGIRAVDEVDLQVRPGNVVGLVGPNGAGKTTLIDAITGMVQSSGDVLIDGRSISTSSPRRRARAGIGRSFQSLELFDSMTVAENLLTAADRPSLAGYLTDLLHPGPAMLDAHVAAVVREFGLADVLDRQPTELSYGKRRLVAIARAIAARPSVLLLDEPAAGLDETESTELGVVIRRLADSWGLAVLMIEHDMTLVLGTCDRITVLDQGRCIAEGSPDEVRTNPAVIEAYLGHSSPDTRTSIDVSVEPPSSVGAGVAVPIVSRRPVLVVRDLCAGYGDLEAVHGIDLEVGTGEVVALLGANGAGKTTTLLTIAGELPAISGSIEIFGSTAVKPLHRRARDGVAFVAEERSLINTLTVRRNLRLGRGSVAEAVELFPALEALLDRPAGLLSGGEQQMLILARALSRHPQLLLVDELSLGLAPIIVDRLLVAIRHAADNGLAVLLVEQHTSGALSIADRAVVLQRGRVELTGSAADLRRQLHRVESAYLTGVA